MIILITGATSGIGEGCARKYAAEGHTLVLNGRNAEKLETLRKTLTAEYNVPIMTLCFDVRDRPRSSWRILPRCAMNSRTSFSR